MFQADSSIFFTSRYTYLWKITDILLSGRRITRFDFFVFKVNLFVVSQSQILLVILFTVCHAWDNYDVSPKNSVLDQQMISLLIFQWSPYTFSIGWETNWEQNFLKMLTSPHVIASILRKCSETLMIRSEHFLKSSKIIKSIPFAATFVELWQKHWNILFEGTQALDSNIFRTDSCALYVLFSSSA